MNTTQKAVQSLGRYALTHHLHIAVAESCTGGLLAQAIVSEPGSSKWFDSALITYSNASKTRLLGIPKSVLDTQGAVSQKVVEAMATGLFEVSGANCSIAITGIAGPEGGTAEKPIGTVWIAFATREGRVHAEKHVFSGDRTHIREQAVLAALQGMLVFEHAVSV